MKLRVVGSFFFERSRFSKQMLKRIITRMGIPQSRTWTTINVDGTQRSSSWQFGAEAHAYKHQTITENKNDGGKVVIEAKRENDEYWTVNKTMNPYFFSLFDANSQSENFTIPTIQAQLKEVKTNEEMIQVLKQAPAWMQEDKTQATLDYFKNNQHPPTKAQLNALQQVLEPDSYKELTKVLLNNYIRE